NENFKIYHNLHRKCKLQGFKPHIVFRVDRMTLITNLVSTSPSIIGVGANLFSENSLHNDIKTVPFNDTTFSWSIYLINKRGKTLSTQAAKFKKRVQNFNII
ncbi:MAG TPA: LysR family transcriptional regulator substrate-binding protein, partial [Oscillospiraceae bacterium]|nr:LysR family transcriptional regulator substrate-binding protein [Oscillospiraceae bacterium]